MNRVAEDGLRHEDDTEEPPDGMAKVMRV